MRIDIADLRSRPRLFTANFPNSGSAREDILYIPVPRYTNLRFLDNDVKRLPASALRAASLVVFRTHPPESRILRTDGSVRDYLGKRFRESKLAYVEFDGGTHVCRSLDSAHSIAPAGDQDFCGLLRQAELRALLDRPGVTLPPYPTFHYQGPNKLHSAKFIRLGNVLQSLDNVDTMLFWILPNLLKSRLLLLDSGTMLPLGLRASSYVTESGLLAGHAFAVESFREYGEPVDELMHRLQSLSKEGTTISPALLIASVSKSGRLMERLATAVEQAGIKTERVSFFAATSYAAVHPKEVMSVLDDSFVSYEAKLCPLCHGDQKRAVIRVHPGTYLMELSAILSKTRIRRKDAVQARQFFERYNGLGSISVHVDQPDRLHDAISIDVVRLLRSPLFLERFKNLIRGSLDDGDVVIAPTHEAARKLVGYIESWKHVISVFSEDNALSELPEKLQNVLRQAKRIVVVDDVLITGRRMTSYKRSLARFLSSDAKVLGIVGIARPPSSTSLQSISDMFDKFDAVEVLLLPNWDEADCPWCSELKELNRVGPRLKAISTLKRRVGKLKKKSTGLKSGLFLHWDKPSDAPRRLSRHSPVFGPIGMKEAELFAAVASALQTARDRGELDEDYTTPIAKILDPTFYLVGRYYDPIITASILRAAKRHDLRAPGIDLELARVVERGLRSTVNKVLRAELLLATGLEKLPITTVARELTAEINASKGGVVGFLAAILTPERPGDKDSNH